MGFLSSPPSRIQRHKTRKSYESPRRHDRSQPSQSRLNALYHKRREIRLPPTIRRTAKRALANRNDSFKGSRRVRAFFPPTPKRPPLWAPERARGGASLARPLAKKQRQQGQRDSTPSR